VKREPPASLEVIRAKRRPADVTLLVEFWHLEGTRWWHDPYTLSSTRGPPTPKDYRMLGHALMDDASHLWDAGGAPRPPRRRKVRRRITTRARNHR